MSGMGLEKLFCDASVQHMRCDLGSCSLESKKSCTEKVALLPLPLYRHEQGEKTALKVLNQLLSAFKNLLRTDIFF